MLHHHSLTQAHQSLDCKLISCTSSCGAHLWPLLGGEALLWRWRSTIEMERRVSTSAPCWDQDRIKHTDSIWQLSWSCSHKNYDSIIRNEFGHYLSWAEHAGDQSTRRGCRRWTDDTRPLEGWIWIESRAELKGNGRSVALACLGTPSDARSRRCRRHRMRRASRCRTASHPPRPHVHARRVYRCRPWCPASLASAGPPYHMCPKQRLPAELCAPRPLPAAGLRGPRAPTASTTAGHHPKLMSWALWASRHRPGS
jgi:hypothetical protein